MKRKLLLLTLMLTLLLCGCQLADTNLGETETPKDRLIGVFVTLEHLDLFDHEAYLKDNLDAIAAGKTLDTVDAEQYGGRLYAVLKDRILTNEATGTQTTRQDYVFEGIEGFSYFTPTVFDTETEESYVFTGSDEAISNGHAALKSGDTEEINLTGTIYLSPDHGEGICYLNPVYQSADGSVYAVQGHGYSLSGVMSEGPNITCTLAEETAVTQNGETKTAKTSVSMAIEIMYVPQEIQVVRFDTDDRILSRDVYVPGTVPDEMIPGSDTAYLVVHTVKLDRDGNTVMTSALYDRTKDGFDTYHCRTDGVCVAGYTKLDW